MNVYLKQFLQRGLVFSGFGPIVAGTVYLILSKTLPSFSLSGVEVFCAIVSTYVLAFVQAGASVFHQIEHWPAAKSLLCHFATLYVAYVGCYLVNAWIPFEWTVVAIFSGIFVAAYLVIWLIVMISIRVVSRRFNERLH